MPCRLTSMGRAWEDWRQTRSENVMPSETWSCRERGWGHPVEAAGGRQPEGLQEEQARGGAAGRALSTCREWGIRGGVGEVGLEPRWWDWEPGL